MDSPIINAVEKVNSPELLDPEQFLILKDLKERIDVALLSCRWCGRDYGWYCDESPDHTCHYYSEAGEDDTYRKVKLTDGTWTQVFMDTTGFGPEGETSSSCLFCGEPYERK